MTQERLVARLEEMGVEMSMATYSRIETGKQPYTQDTLEAIADALQTDPASLLWRNPEDEDAIWSIWDQAKPGEKRQIRNVIKAIKTGT
jgi:transcriptional regulator with XRE-family HTH domain